MFGSRPCCVLRGLDKLTKNVAQLELRMSPPNNHLRPRLDSKSLHVSAPLSRSNASAVKGTKISGRDIFDQKKMQMTMNKVMGVRGPFNKVAYKPWLKPRSSGSAVAKQDFQRLQVVEADEEERGAHKMEPSTGSARRARQLSDVLFLRIAEMVHSGGIHPIFLKYKIEILRVRMLEDLRNVHVFWAETGNAQIDAEIDDKLRNEAGWEIRSQIAQLKVMGRAPTVTFIGDSSRIRLNHVTHLIDVSDKPPEDADANNSGFAANKSKKFRIEDDNVADLSQRISAFSFPADAPTWSEMMESVVVMRDARNLDHDRLMNQVVRARVSGSATNVPRFDDNNNNNNNDDGRSVPDLPSGSSSWRLNSQSKDELSTFLRDRRRKLKERKMMGKDDGIDEVTQFDEDDRWDYDENNDDDF